MHKYIVPAKDRIRKWNSYFDEAFRTEEHQKDLMKMLVMMSMALAYDGSKKHNEFIELYEQALVMAMGLVDSGLIYEEDANEVGQLAYEFCVSLVGYLKDLAILSKVPTVMTFEGFVNMDIVIKVLDAGEPYVDETEERACLSG
uniref:Uncharacterized protein n=1 Tax=Burkholderia phage vB_BgluM-SURPRISE13 TaxID=3159457 RepID=A0AAU7PFQ5_9VIRU